MLGAVIGDIVGSPYEFINMYSRRGVRPFEHTLRGRCQFTDDTVLSMAVANALIRHRDFKDEQLLGDKIAENLVKYYKRYPLKKWGRNSCYGSGFAQWADKGDIHVYRTARSNGGAMRIVPVGWLYSSLEETLRVARIATERTHNAKEAVEGAQMVAAAVFMSRKGESKAAIKRYAEQTFGYKVLEGEERLEQLREDSRKYRRKKIAGFKLGEFINCDTKLSVEEALFAFFNTTNFKDCIRTAVAIGGDSDTIACMSGGIAEAFYGDVPADWKYKAGGVLVDGHCRTEDINMVMNFKKYIA